MSKAPAKDKKYDIKNPPWPSDEHNFKGCLTFVDGQLTYYINRRCKADLLYSFWFNYAQSPYGEDPPLENDFYPKLTNRKDWVPYSETIIIKTEDAAWRKEKYPNGYRQSSERLDFYVTKPEFAEAYQAVQKLGGWQDTEQITEVSIFGVVRMILLASAEFGKPSIDDYRAVHWHPAGREALL